MAQIIKADLDEMVFEDRERRYGAYKLRKSYLKHLFIGFGVISLIFLLGSILPTLALGGAESEERREISHEINLADLPEPPPLEEDVPPPPPPVKVPPPKLKTIAFKIPEPKPKEEIVEEEEIIEMDSLLEAPNIGLENQDGADEGFIDIPDEGDGDVPEVIVEEEPDINAFIFDAEEPKPLNLDDIKKLVGYPDIAKDAGIQGSVVVRVLVDKNGRYKKHKIIKKVHPILADAVEKNVNKLKFTPAVQGGKPIPFWVNIPFKFKLLE